MDGTVYQLVINPLFVKFNINIFVTYDASFTSLLRHLFYLICPKTPRFSSMLFFNEIRFSSYHIRNSLIQNHNFSLKERNQMLHYHSHMNENMHHFVRTNWS